MHNVRQQRISGAFHDANGEPVNIRGDYDVSTLYTFGRAMTETVLFKTDGIGPDQIELWHGTGSPDAATVLERLRSGAFYALNRS